MLTLVENMAATLSTINNNGNAVVKGSDAPDTINDVASVDGGRNGASDL